MAGETILVVDDSPTILKVVELVLTKAGYTVFTAADGDEGVEKAKEHKPDLILLDFVMPKMNGYEVCRALHDEDDLTRVPVVLMSAKGDQVGDRFVKVMGIVDYISKPFSPEAISAVVEHTLVTYAQREIEEEDAALLEEVDPEVAVDAADAAAEAQNQALGSMRHAISTVVSESIVAGAEQLSVDLPIDHVGTWVDEALSKEMLSVLVGDLRASAPELAGANDAVLTGDLRLIPLAEVLLLLQQQEQLGVLTVTRGSAQIDIYFHEGNIEFASASGMPDEFLLGRYILESHLMTEEELELFLRTRKGSSRLLGHQLVKLGYITSEDLKEAMRNQTRELLYELLRWNFGRFTFRATSELGPLAADAALGLSPEGILMEGFRRVDKWHLIEREIENFDIVFLRNDDAIAQLKRGQLTRDELAVLELVSGKNSVKDIVRQSRLGSFDVSKMLFRLLSTGLIRKRVKPVAV
jgi:DNA-binding response OmpR family regulator